MKLLLLLLCTLVTSASAEDDFARRMQLRDIESKLDQIQRAQEMQADEAWRRDFREAATRQAPTCDFFKVPDKFLTDRDGKRYQMYVRSCKGELIYDASHKEK